MQLLDVSEEMISQASCSPVVGDVASPSWSAAPPSGPAIRR